MKKPKKQLTSEQMQFLDPDGNLANVAYHKTYKDIEKECRDIEEGTRWYSQALMNPDTAWRAKTYWDVFVLNVKRLIAAYPREDDTMPYPGSKP